MSKKRKILLLVVGGVLVLVGTFLYFYRPTVEYAPVNIIGRGR